MVTGTGNIIESIDFYNCGFCSNNLSHMFKGAKPQKIDFQARVLLIKHQIEGYILVDTGYSTRVYENGWISKLYTSITPTTVLADQSIIRQLRADGIEETAIKTIILSHLHPDHIGGVYDFPSSSIVMSLASRTLMASAKFKDLVFKNQISEKISTQIEGVELMAETPLDGFKGKDLYGDGSLWLIDLPGHAYGQLGIYLPEVNLFYVADAVWGREFLDNEMKRLPQKVQYDYSQYKGTIEKIKKVAMTGVQVISTHGNEAYVYGQ